MEARFTMNDLLHIIRKRILFIILLPITFALIGAYISYNMMTPTYEARVDLLVNNTLSTEDNQLTSMDIETNLQLIETYQFIIQSDYILDKVREAHSMNMSNDTLKKKLHIETNNNSQIISLYVRDHNLQQSVEIANSIATNIRNEVKTLMNIQNIQILTYASINKHSQPIAPKPIFYTLLSFIGGFLIVIIYLFLSTYFHMRISSKEYIERSLQLPIFGMVSKMKSSSFVQIQGVDENNVNQPNFTHIAPEVMESFRTIRTNIQFQSKVSKPQSIVVTSASKGEGKSIISEYLAMMIACDHKKTIIIKADFRNDANKKTTAYKGLSTHLTGYDSIWEIIKDTSTPNLKIIYAGPTPPMSTELLSSTQMDVLLVDLKKHYDFIIIDSPPLLLADATVLATKADGCLLIAQADKTKVKHMKGAVEQLKQVNATILGVVLNKTKIRKREIRKYNGGNRWGRRDKRILTKIHSQ